jgi:RNA polymerase sigma factor FliA
MVDVSSYSQIENDKSHDVDLMSYIGLVKRIAIYLKGRVPDYIQLEDMIQIGTLGLIEASKAYKPSVGVDFEVFAKNRVRGAILDEIRKLSSIPRSAVSHLQQHNKTAMTLSHRLGRSPTQTEIAEELGLSTEAFHKEREHANRFQTTSLELTSDDNTDLTAQDLSSVNPETLVSNREINDRVALAISQLSKREQLVISLYHKEEMNLKEIGVILGVNESRVSQILSATVAKLRITIAEITA